MDIVSRDVTNPHVDHLLRTGNELNDFIVLLNKREYVSTFIEHIVSNFNFINI